MVKKEVVRGGTSGQALVPRTWKGERVKAVKVSREGEEVKPPEEIGDGRYAIHGYSLIDKEAVEIGNGATVYLPEDWLGEEVCVVRVTKSKEYDGVECPTCGRKDFDTKRAMKVHHASAHEKSLNQTTAVCEECGEEFIYNDYGEGRRFCKRECWEAHNET